MEFIDGELLSDWLKKERSFAERLEMGIKLAKMTVFWHKQRLLNKELKPENIMVRKNGEPVFVDFDAAMPLDLKLRKELPNADRVLNVVKEITSPFCTEAQIRKDRQKIMQEETFFNEQLDIFAFGWLLVHIVYPRVIGDLIGSTTDTQSHTREYQALKSLAQYRKLHPWNSPAKERVIRTFIRCFAPRTPHEKVIKVRYTSMKEVLDRLKIARRLLTEIDKTVDVTEAQGGPKTLQTSSTRKKADGLCVSAAVSGSESSLSKRRNSYLERYWDGVKKFHEEIMQVLAVTPQLFPGKLRSLIKANEKFLQHSDVHNVDIADLKKMFIPFELIQPTQTLFCCHFFNGALNCLIKYIEKLQALQTSARAFLRIIQLVISVRSTLF